jgi:DNA polymerase III subunit delta'
MAPDVAAHGYVTKGQPAALDAIRRQVRSGAPPHALLLAGPPQVGKTTLALDLAAALLCSAPDPDERPCRTCAACRKVAHGNHADLHRLAPEGAGDQIRLAQVQALISDLALIALEGGFRLAVIEQAHRLNQDAQNALLKTLEEPPPKVVIVLAVDDEGLILPTVRSRCVRLRLGPVSPRVIVELLEGRGLADAVRATALARLSAGRPGLALALAYEPEATLIHARLMRGLLDLLSLDRRHRFDAVGGLLADAAALDEATDRGMRSAALAGFDPGGDAEVGAGGRAAGGRAAGRTTGRSTRASAATARAAGGATISTATVELEAADPAPTATSGDTDPAAADDAEESPAAASRRAPAAASSRSRATPIERRRAALRVLAAWRDLTRDLLVAGSGGRRQIRQVELLEELEAAAVRVERAELVAFLAGLDVLTAAIETYANPELVLDVLLLRWPRAATTSRQAA